MKSQYTEIDRWLKSKLNTLLRDVQDRFDDYDPTAAGRMIQEFVTDQLSNWYVRLNRKRFWRGELTDDKRAAYQTLHEALVVVSQLMAPIAPFYADRLYTDLTKGLSGAADSVHLSLLPDIDATAIDQKLEERMDYAQRIVSLGFSLRKKEDIRVRQPLSKILIPVIDESSIKQIKQVSDLILQELNVKEIEYISGDALSKTIKPNFRVLGKKVGKQMKAAAAIINAMDADAIKTLEQLGSYSIELDGAPYELEREDVDIATKDIPGWTIASDGNLTLALDLTLTDELRDEGLARELVNRIQNVRKDSGLEVTDRITISISPNEQVQQATDSFGDYIRQETLADELSFAENVDGATTIDLGQDVGEVQVSVVRVQTVQ